MWAVLVSPSLLALIAVAFVSASTELESAIFDASLYFAALFFALKGKVAGPGRFFEVLSCATF